MVLPASHENLSLNFGFLQGRPRHFAYIALLPLFREFSRKESRLVCVVLHAPATLAGTRTGTRGLRRKIRGAGQASPVELGTNTLSRFDELLRLQRSALLRCWRIPELFAVYCWKLYCCTYFTTQFLIFTHAHIVVLKTVKTLNLIY